MKSSVATSLLLGLMIYVLLSQPRLYYLFLFLLTQSIKLVLYKPLCSMGIALTTYKGTEHARQQAGTLDRLINPHTRPGLNLGVHSSQLICQTTEGSVITGPISQSLIRSLKISQSTCLVGLRQPMKIDI